MSLGAYTLQSVAVHLNVTTTDSMGGRNSSWQQIGMAKAHVATLGVKATLFYRREGLDVTKRLQFENRLTRKLSGFTNLYDLLMAQTLEKTRFKIAGRTMVPIRMNLSCDGKVGPDVLNVDCIDYVRQHGYEDV